MHYISLHVAAELCAFFSRYASAAQRAVLYMRRGSTEAFRGALLTKHRPRLLVSLPVESKASPGTVTTTPGKNADLPNVRFFQAKIS